MNVPIERARTAAGERLDVAATTPRRAYRGRIADDGIPPDLPANLREQ